MTLCDDCRGACCVSVAIPIRDVHLRDIEWLKARGALEFKPTGDAIWRIASRCRHLTPAGQCDIYSKRPQSCRDYQVGGLSCLAAREAAKGGG